MFIFDSSINPIAKLSTVWGGVSASKLLALIGITTWGDFAAICAALYSLALLLDLIIKWRKRDEADK